MSRKARPESKTRKAVQDAVHVSAVRSVRGPPSTTVHVELKPDKLKSEVGAFERVEEVVAEIPDKQADSVRWQEERLYKGAPEPADGTLQYSSTHYGPSDSGQYAVGVRIKTDAGTFRASKASEHYTMRDVDKPEPSPHLKPRGRK